MFISLYLFYIKTLGKPKRELIETLPVGSKKKQSLIRLIADGIRIDPDSSSTYAGFLCVVCLYLINSIYY